MLIRCSEQVTGDQRPVTTLSHGSVNWGMIYTIEYTNIRHKNYFILLVVKFYKFTYKTQFTCEF